MLGSRYFVLQMRKLIFQGLQQVADQGFKPTRSDCRVWDARRALRNLPCSVFFYWFNRWLLNLLSTGRETSKEMNNKLISYSDEWYQENETGRYVLTGFLFSACGDRSPFWNPPTSKPIIGSVPTMRPNRWRSSCPTVPLESTPSTATLWRSAVTAGPALPPPRSVRPSETGVTCRHSRRAPGSRTHLHGQHEQLHPLNSRTV